ncbi:hypothetical protein Bbelb_276710 [Branchiostoma belcheri]|nr:hypothetical protein Bbelb_276710 [Branchiostoma belcheri]
MAPKTAVITATAATKFLAVIAAVARIQARTRQGRRYRLEGDSAMVPKTSEIMATSAAKVLEATTVVSMTATKRRGQLDALTSNGSWGDGPADAEAMVPKTAGNSSDSCGEVFKATTVVAAEAMVPKTAGNSSDSGGEVFKATTVVAADAMVRKMARAAPKVLQATVMVAVTATIQDATRAAMSPRK